MNKLLLFLTAAAALFSACGKDDPDPVDQLPPATQTGANTFGCLVNGQPWTPKGNNGTSNYTVSYDPAYRYGTLNVGAYRYVGKGTNDYQIVGIYSDSLRHTGVCKILPRGRHGASVVDRMNGCEAHSIDAGTFCRGQFTITRLDLQAGIVSGTFSFTLYKPGCDSIRVTDGRFDRKL
ncbi:hypothetical protein GCM10023185_12310 [Hymenobacter saemangeumensis]|uniref:Lipoprotein n=1 Tax=Hymenobacter saemangeumensis TaxID=1084522 RepID=A0ABP8I6P9_9BACT